MGALADRARRHGGGRQGAGSHGARPSRLARRTHGGQGGLHTMRALAIALVIVVLGFAAAPAGEISLRIVNVVTPQDVKVWEPTSFTAKKGDTVVLQLVNRHADEHGFEIAAFNVKEVVPGEKTANVKFVADKAGIFPIKCQLHPAHVTGQLIVLE